MARPNFIELPGVEPIPILYEDRSVLAIDKPRGWMLVPVSWQKTSRNLQAAINSSIAARDFWARSRNLKYLKYVHRLDADTSGVMLFAKSPGALESYSALFESRRMEKSYLAVVHGTPTQDEWTCKLNLAQDSRQIGRMKVDERNGKEAETHFRVVQVLQRPGQIKQSNLQTASSPRPSPPLQTEERVATGRERRKFESNQSLVTSAATALIEARPLTGRTHQIRVHLTESGYPIIGDELYGRAGDKANLALRAASLAYVDPFTRRRVEIKAPTEDFRHEFGFATE